MENSKIAIVSGMFLLVAIGAFLIIPMSQEKTLILTTRDETNPVSCLAGDQLILAQNLTDLCDVVIISPQTNQTLIYNGTYWVNTDQVIFNDTSTCQNIGNGSAFICLEGTNIDFRSILAGTGINVSNNTNTITISNTRNNFYQLNDTNIIDPQPCDMLAESNPGPKWNNLPQNLIFIAGSNMSLQYGVDCTVVFDNTNPESTACANLGSVGEGIFVSGNCNFKKLLAGSSISLSANGTRITITNTSPESSVCSGQTGNYNIVASSSGGNCSFKNLTFGNGISLSSNSTHIIITNSKPEQGCTSAGGTSIWKTTTTCDAKGLTAGVGLTLTSNTNDNNYKTNFVNGTGISITGSTSQTFTNTGVTSLTSADTDGLSLSGSTGAITITPKWELLCQNSLGSSGSTVSCNSFTARKHIFVTLEFRATGGTGIEPAWQFNSDSGTNYAHRLSVNGAADSTGTGISRCNAVSGGGTLVASGGGGIAELMIYNNQSGDRKVGFGQAVNGIDTSSATAPNKAEITCKWSNTSAQITTITAIIQSGTGSYDTGSVLTVWGYD